jgi:hypothetical protein
MLTRTLASVSTLESNDESQLIAELRLARARAQLAVVRTLADRIEVLVNPRLADGLNDHLIEEMARLGCRLFEAAAELTRSPAPEETGVFNRPPAMRAT